MQRRYDIDALRALAFCLLILYHCAMLYVADWGWHLKSAHLSEGLQWPMLLVNRWRMDLIFLISGLSVHFLLRGTGAGRFLAQRSWRLLLPLTFGCLFVVPIQPYAQGVANGLVEPGFGAFLLRYYQFRPWPQGAFDGWQYGFTWNHLWYLAYLWVYTVALTALLPLLRSRAGSRLQAALASLRGWTLLALPALPLALFSILLQPHFQDTGDLIHDWHRHAIYFTVFLYGYWLGNDAGLWSELTRLRRRTLALAPLLFAAYLALITLLPEDVPDGVQYLIWTLRSVYIWTALCAILGWSHQLLNRPLRWLPWATEAVYPWYVLHQSLIVLIAYWILPLKFGPVAEPAIVLTGTVAGCFVLHEIVRRVPLLRPCFGLKARRQRVPAGLGAASAPAPKPA
ncbi:Peptidoglycan/LPS O-acetylase OafA/YrhL, contains acyltransferase and SGNH-hydrolase domains [Lysobacter sp. yr284]|uniref:acyltransferase family protein n=1 Tax=Lysobacter sp. yr284 TaxID=1761791 RepID=UPI00089A7263|nr:acyltransferase family protein [Lysobacter sp. yr284]SDY25017.1 Peptidoglycan/LPS O-acetylase OafA/YrhL, contains acyltransferase and SGNH-hydrolase domains [Lysobacter sp. yr284]